VHDTGNQWLIDDLFVTDALAEAQAQLPGKFARPLQAVETYANGDQKRFEFVNDNEQFLNIVLQWPGSRFSLRVVDPTGFVVAHEESETPPITVPIPEAMAGRWSFEVTALQVADIEPAALVVGVFDADDFDRDGVPRSEDNCPSTANLGQEDGDGDGVGDQCDNCSLVVNPDQEDFFPLDAPEGPGNGVGDACESIPDDLDGDGLRNDGDNCPTVANRGQEDTDGDGLGDACDSVWVRIDVRPESPVNPVNPLARGIIPVAVLGSRFFDVGLVDVATLAFGPGRAPERHQLATPGVLTSHLMDVNRDGFTDLLCHFEMAAAGIGMTETQACVASQTTDGVAFDACDAIVIVPRSSGVGPRRP